MKKSSYQKWVDDHRPKFFPPKKSWLSYLLLVTVSGLTRAFAHLLGSTTTALYNVATPERMPRDDPAETNALIRKLHGLTPINLDAAVDDVYSRIQKPLSHYHPIITSLITPNLTPPTWDPHTDLIGKAKWRDKARAFLSNYSSVDTAKAMQPVLEAITLINSHAPSTSDASPFKVPLLSFIDDLPGVVEKVINAFFSDYLVERHLYEDLRRQLDANATDDKGNFTPPTKSKLPPQALPEHYLKNTPLLQLFHAQIPFAIPLSAYKEHGFLFAKSGHGKTQTLRALFASLLNEDCALFLIDGNGSLIEGIDRIKGIQDRLIVLDPADPPALNFFKLRGGSREKQMELFFYLFKAIDQGLTERQATMVSYLMDFMHAIPGSTLDTLREVCDAKDLPYQQHLAKTPQITQDFFRKQFLSADQLVKQTKSQIAQRLYTLSRNQAFINMFNAPENKFDAYEAIKQKKIVVVNTTRNDLGDHGSAVFGRFILAQCLAAAFQRPKNERHLALIICDEAKAYLDDQSQKILSDARAFGLGLLLASQFPDQLPEGVRKEVINNTTVKFAGPAAYSVVAQLTRDMRCQPEFILGMKKVDRSHADWACYVDNVTPAALKLSVPFGTIEKLPRLNQAEWFRFRVQNRDRYGATSHNSTPPQSPTSTPDEDIVW